MSTMMWLLSVTVFIASISGPTQGQCTSGSPPCQLTCRCSDPTSCQGSWVSSGCGSQGCQLGWSGDTCQRQNTVYESRNTPGSTVLGSSNEYDEGEFNMYMVNAFDGLQNTSYASEFETNPYLWVKLPHRTYISSMNITAKGDQTSTQNVQIHVSDSRTFSTSSLCYESNLTTKMTEYNINCTRALLGQYVRIQVMSITRLFVMEWEIYKCADYWFGDGCSRLCNCRDPTQICHGVSGQCGSGCPDGYTGDCYSEVAKSWGLIAAVVVLGIICAALMMYAIMSTLKWRRFRRLYQKEIKARYVTYKVRPEEETPVYEEVGPTPTQAQES